MADIHSIAGFTGPIELVDQDGESREVWCQAGVVQIGDASAFMIVPNPPPGQVWSLTRVDQIHTNEIARDDIAAALWAEYKRVDEWCKFEKDDAHSARVAIRCCASRLGVYSLFVAQEQAINGAGEAPAQGST